MNQHATLQTDIEEQLGHTPPWDDLRTLLMGEED
tara:strand:- start:2002 stop:2103 length:102 start_codon:yes stop_codon:yes gene_type:complete